MPRSYAFNSSGFDVGVPNGPGQAATNPHYVLTGPTSGSIGQSAFGFQFKPLDMTPTDTVTFSDGGAGGTFAPVSISFTSLDSARFFTYTPPGSGTFSISLISDDGHSFSPDPFDLVVDALDYPAADMGTLPSGLPSAYIDTTGRLLYILVQVDQGGSGATATAHVTDGSISSFDISGGSGYSVAPNVYVSGGGGSGFAGTAVLTGDAVSSITINNPGTRYTSAPTVTISAVNRAGVSSVNVPLTTGITAVTGTPTIYKNGVSQTLLQCVDTVTLGAGGSGYTSAPTVTVTPDVSDTTGSGAVVFANLTGTAVSSLTLKLGGANYTAPVTLSFSGGGGSGATATATVGPVWESVVHNKAWVVYPLPEAASADDTWTFDAPDGWLSMGFPATAAIQSAPITVYTGEVEQPPIGWGASQFGTNTGSFQWGINAGWPTSNAAGPYYQARNWLHRATYNWFNSLSSQAVTSDSGGHPLTITSSNGNANITLVNGNIGGVSQSQSTPQVQGVYTFTATENATDPAASMVVALTYNVGSVVVTSIATPDDGPGRKTWQWLVQTASPWPAGLNAGIGLSVTTPTAAPGDWTLSDEWLSMPSAFEAAPVGSIVVTGFGAGFGSGYTDPTVTITGGGGSGATASAVLVDGAVTIINITNPGTGYTSRPNVVFSGGSPITGGALPTAFVVLINTTVAYIKLTDCGHGLTTEPTIAITGGGGSGAMASVPILSNGVIRTITVSDGGSGYTAPPTVVITDPDGTGATALAVLASPGQAVPDDEESAADLNVVGWLTTPNSKVPAWLRIMDGNLGFDSFTNIIDAEDLKSVSDTSWVTIPQPIASTTLSGDAVGSVKVTWGGVYFDSAPTVVFGPGGGGTGASATATVSGGQITAVTMVSGGSGYASAPSVGFLGGTTATKSRNVLITQFGPYTPTPDVNDKVFVSDNWTGTVASAPGAPLPYYWVVPEDVGINYMGGPAFGSSNTSFYVGEATTSAAHGLKTGQSVSWSQSAAVNVQVANAGNIDDPVTINIHTVSNAIVWVTGPDTFSFTLGGPGTLRTNNGIANIVAPVSASALAAIIVPDAGTLPYEVAASLGKDIGCNIKINIPFAATLDCTREIASRVLAIAPSNILIGVEYTNEHWDSAWARNWIPWSAGALQSPQLSNDQVYTQRAAQVQDAFWGVFNDAHRGNQIVRLFGSFTTDGGITQRILDYASANDIRVDVIMPSKYVKAPDDPPFVSAAALLATEDSRSPMYQGANPWTQPMQSSIIRHHMKYSSNDQPTWRTQMLLCGGYSGPTPAFGPKPIVGCYETSPYTFIPNGAGGLGLMADGNVRLRAQMTEDMRYDPSIYGVQSALAESMQDDGLSYGCQFSLAGVPSTDGDSSYTAIYPIFAWPGQAWGLGDGTDGRAVNRFASTTGYTAGFDLANVSVVGQAWRDWADFANAPTPTPTPTRWFPGFFGMRIGVR